MSADRPTREQVTTALATAEQSRPPNYVAVLAAEVRALRVELKQTLEAHERQAASIRGLQRDLDLFRAASEAAELRIVELREELKFATARADDNEATVRRLLAAITRLEELCERWKGRITADHWAPAACEVEAALRGAS